MPTQWNCCVSFFCRRVKSVCPPWSWYSCKTKERKCRGTTTCKMDGLPWQGSSQRRHNTPSWWTSVSWFFHKIRTSGLIPILSCGQGGESIPSQDTTWARSRSFSCSVSHLDHGQLKRRMRGVGMLPTSLFTAPTNSVVGASGRRDSASALACDRPALYNMVNSNSDKNSSQRATIAGGFLKLAKCSRERWSVRITNCLPSR